MWRNTFFWWNEAPPPQSHHEIRTLRCGCMLGRRLRRNRSVLLTKTECILSTWFKCGLNQNLPADLGSTHLFSWSYLEELSIHHCAVWLTKHAGKCFRQWQSLPDPEVLMTLSRPKPSGKSNGCFCQVLKSKCFMTPEERKRTRRGDDLPSGHRSIFIQSKSNQKEQRTINSEQSLLIFQRENWIKHNKVVSVLLTFGIVSSSAVTHRYEIHEHFTFMLVNLLETFDSTDSGNLLSFGSLDSFWFW